MIFIFLQYLWVRNLMWLSWLFWLWDSVSWLSWEASQGSGGCWYRSFFYRLLDWGCISSQGRFLITDLVSLFVIGLLRFSISSCFSLGNLTLQGPFWYHVLLKISLSVKRLLESLLGLCWICKFLWVVMMCLQFQVLPMNELEKSFR